jgi:CheY-like chemotaxis protein
MHVLVVDDESTNRRLCERMLKRVKCTVVCLEDGDEVLGELLRCGYMPPQLCRDSSAVAGAGVGDGDGDVVVPFSLGVAADVAAARGFQRVDVILLDIMMQRSNGVDVAVELRRLFRMAGGTSGGVCGATPTDADVAVHSLAAPVTGDCASSDHSWERQRHRLPPIVAMTGNTSLQNIETYKLAGFRHVLPKPFDVSGLLSTLQLLRHTGI